MWSKKSFGKHRAMEGRCENCGHIWQEHMSENDRYRCGECDYEIEHEDPNAPVDTCTLVPPSEVLRYQS